LFQISQNSAAGFLAAPLFSWPLLSYEAEQSASWQHWPFCKRDRKAGTAAKNCGVHHLQQVVLLRGHSIALPNPVLNKNKNSFVNLHLDLFFWDLRICIWIR
jgi:hypothetical protein